jgi:Kdo2-lipid IVA lauroyltransferase/acyltransferase
LANALAKFFNVALQVVQITQRPPYFKSILKTVFQLLSYMPLTVLHAAGTVLGLLVWACSGVYRRRLAENSALAGFGWRTALAAAVQAGKMVAELPRIWLGRPVRVIWNDLPAAQAVFERSKSEGKGIIILSPHLGCWEVVGQSIADMAYKGGEPGGNRMTVMYRPARQAWLDEIIRASRAKPSMQTVPADLSGVRQTLRVLKGGGIIGLLPDQVPPDGMGTWSNMFGKPAYTMTMAAKLAQTTTAIAVLCWCERLSFGRGYRMFTRVLDLDLSADLDGVVQQINVEVEVAIRALPDQYLWGYARYKQPKTAQAEPKVAAA